MHQGRALGGQLGFLMEGKAALPCGVFSGGYESEASELEEKEKEKERWKLEGCNLNLHVSMLGAGTAVEWKVLGSTRRDKLQYQVILDRKI